MAKLIFTNQEHAGQSYELTLEKTTVGRAADNTLVIADGSLSAHHCEILVNGTEVIVRDLGSRNGTIANGLKLLNHQSQLKSGQTVRFGTIEARLELDGGGNDSEDSGSEMTAVHTMGRILREQQKERENPRPANPSMKLESPGSVVPDERTATDCAPPRPGLSTVPAPAPPPATPPRKSPGKTVVIVSAALMLGLIALVWLLWSRK